MSIHVIGNSGTDYTGYFKFGMFPGGEPLVELVSSIYKEDDFFVSVYVQGHSNDQFMQLVSVLDVLQNQDIDTQLVIPYFPGGRQDRRESTALTVKLYADILNSFDLEYVRVVDPHSMVTPAVINKVYAAKQPSYGKDSYTGYNSYTGFIAPDLGASKRVEDEVLRVNQGLGPKIKFAQGSKRRDPKTGRLSGFQAPLLSGGKWLITDDICDGGGTFIGLAQEIKKRNSDLETLELDLYVTHGIFSKGLDILAEHFTKIITTNSFDNGPVGTRMLDNGTEFEVIDVLDTWVQN